MTGITDLDELLHSMAPELQEGEYVFCTVDGSYVENAHLNPLASFIEAEGLSLIVSVTDAECAGLCTEGRLRLITLTVHSSLDAVGLTAAVATKLTKYGISANVVAARYHDHIFVPAGDAQQALQALRELSQ